jgi:hypothetical protein
MHFNATDQIYNITFSTFAMQLRKLGNKTGKVNNLVIDNMILFGWTVFVVIISLSLE